MEWKVTARQKRTVISLAMNAVLQDCKKVKQGKSSHGNQVQPMVQWLPDKSIVARRIQGQPAFGSAGQGQSQQGTGPGPVIAVTLLRSEPAVRFYILEGSFLNSVPFLEEEIIWQINILLKIINLFYLEQSQTLRF